MFRETKNPLRFLTNTLYNIHTRLVNQRVPFKLMPGPSSPSKMLPEQNTYKCPTYGNLYPEGTRLPECRDLIYRVPSGYRVRCPGRGPVSRPHPALLCLASDATEKIRPYSPRRAPKLFRALPRITHIQKLTQYYPKQMQACCF
jgi:hypothetical protein